MDHQMDEHEINIFWKKIVNTINDGLMFIGPEGSILMVNKAFETLTGYSSKEAVGMSCEILGCDACEQVLQTSKNSSWCKLFDTGQQDMKKCRCLLKVKDGSYLSILKNASVLKDKNGKIMGVVETLTDISEIVKLDEKIQTLSKQYCMENDFFGQVGKSKTIQLVFDMIRKAAESSAPVIFFGESGTGKELAANAVHMCGTRKKGPFIQLNCAALNESVLESEMFGHVKGAFTGAYNNRIGRFEAANRGDFFLDEIGDMPLSLQTKLLRVIESGKFERVGDISSIHTDVRIITATNKNLEQLIEAKKFRQDLFFRINVIPIYLPPLRERAEDLPLLIHSFISRLNRKTGKAIKGVSNDVMDLFMHYNWPGNIRELKNAIEYGFITAEEQTICLEHLPKNICLKKTIEPGSSLAGPDPKNLSDEKHQLITALKKTNGNQTRAAKMLSINRVTVWNRMKKYKIDLKKILTV